jgi:hypothetical protein
MGLAGHCVAKQFALDKKHTHGKSCCEKDGKDNHCLEGSDVEAAEVQSPVVAHKHKSLFPWLHEHRHHHNHNHHHHHHHHEKKEKEDPCCKDEEDHSVPCCTSARCEQKVLTSRGKGHRHSHIFGTSFGIGNKKGLTSDVELCSSQCCSDPTPTPTVQLNCGSDSKCCLPQTPKSNAVALPHQKSRALELDADCCSKVAHKETIPVEKSKGKTGGGCCVKGNCKPSEAPVITSSANTPRCCTNGECKDSASDFHKDTALTGAIHCCATGMGKTAEVCKSSKTTCEVSKEAVAVDHKSASGKSNTRCCADVKCMSLQGEAKVLPDTLALNKPEDAATTGMCCADASSCKSCVAPSG